MSTVEDEHDFVGWIRDAREGAWPVLITGLVLLCSVLDWPLWSAILALGLMMAMGLVVCAVVAFPVSGPEHPDR